MGADRCRSEGVGVVLKPGAANDRKTLIVVKDGINTGIYTSFPMHGVLTGHQMRDRIVVCRQDDQGTMDDRVATKLALLLVHEIERTGIIDRLQLLCVPCLVITFPFVINRR